MQKSESGKIKTKFFKYFSINKYMFYFLPVICFSILRNVSGKRIIIYFQFAFLFVECVIEFYIEDMRNGNE